MRLPGRRPATEPMNTIDALSDSVTRARRTSMKWARRLRSNVLSQSSMDVPATPMPKPVPTLSTSPSGANPGSSEMARRHPSSVVTSATTIAAFPPSSVISRHVSSTAASSRSTQTTDAPSRAARTAMARPLPTGGSGSREGCVPAPMTVMLRPFRSDVIRTPESRVDPSIRRTARHALRQRLRAGFQLYAQGAEHGRPHHVVADQHEQLNELALPQALRQRLPRTVGHGSRVRCLVDGAQRGAFEGGPFDQLHRALAVTHRDQLGWGHSLDLSQPDVLCPLIAAAEAGGGTQNHQLAQAAGEASRQQRATETQPAPEQFGVGPAQRGEDVHRLVGAARRVLQDTREDVVPFSRCERWQARPGGGHGRIVDMHDRPGLVARRPQRSGRDPIGGGPDPGRRRTGASGRETSSRMPYSSASSAPMNRPRSTSLSTVVGA